MRKKKVVTEQRINKKEKGDALMQGCCANCFLEHLCLSVGLEFSKTCSLL